MVRDQEPKGRGGEDVGLFAAHNAKRRAGAQGRKKRAVFQLARWHAAQKSPEKMRLGRSGFGHFRYTRIDAFPGTASFTLVTPFRTSSALARPISVPKTG